MPNYLGIDYGTQRMGLAWADDLLIALPGGGAGVEREGCWEALAREIKQRSVTDWWWDILCIWMERLGGGPRKWIIY